MYPITAMVPRGTSVLPAFLIVPSVSLFIAYIWARATRPDAPPWDPAPVYGSSGSGADGAASGRGKGDLGRYMAYQEDSDGAFRWPSWYRAMETPYDYQPPSRLAQSGEEVKLRILLDADLSPRSSLLPYVLSLLTTVRINDHVDIYQPAPAPPPKVPDTSGIADTDSATTEAEALREAELLEDERWAEQCRGYDLIWRIEESSRGPSGTSEGRKRRKRRGCGDVPVLSDNARLGIPVSADRTANITLIHNPSQLLGETPSYPSLKALHGDDWEMGLYAYILPSADPGVYHPSKRISRRTVTYFPPPSYAYLPKTDRPVFPYDARWDVHVPRVLPESVIKKLNKGNTNAWEDESGRSEVREWVRKEEKRRAGKMRNSGLCLFDTWTDGLTAEMAQAMLSGCVVVGVVPDIKRDQFQDLILPLDPNAQFNETDPSIPIRQIEHILHQTSTTTLDRIALRAFVFARRELVIRRKVEDVRSLLEVWSRGGRGYQFTSGFRWTCSTPVAAGGERPPWCAD